MKRTTPIYGYRHDGAKIVSQKDAVFYYLQSGQSLTQNEAMINWSIARLPSVIHKIRCQLAQEGSRFRIETNMVEDSNKFGAKCRFAKYTLIEKTED